MSCWSSPTTKDAYRLSWASLIITAVAAIVGCCLFSSTGSSLLLVFGLENCVDFLSSAVVLWRFFAPSSVDDKVERNLRRREKRASVSISFVLVLLGIFIMGAAIADYTRGEEDVDQENVIIGLSFFSMLVFGTLAALKFRYARILESPSLYKDGICSLIGTVLSGALFINTLLIKASGELWWIDPTVALLAGVAAIHIGAQAIVYAVNVDKLPIFTASWWLLSQGDGGDEVSGRPLGPEDFPGGVPPNRHDGNLQSNGSKDDQDPNTGLELAETDKGSSDEDENKII